MAERRRICCKMRRKRRTPPLTKMSPPRKAPWIDFEDEGSDDVGETRRREGGVRRGRGGVEGRQDGQDEDDA